MKQGARWIILCDTNGGTLPHDISEILKHVAQTIPPEKLGIHTHDDTGNAVANSLAAIQAGCCMVQGTLNGLGERCGNANLISLIPTLSEKLNYDIGISREKLKDLRSLSRMLDELLNQAPASHAPYVGDRAFAHKGGLHVSAIMKDPQSYEHISPNLVGNSRLIIVSDQSGKSNLLATLKNLNIEIDASDPKLQILLETIKKRESEGYAYDGAEASFELLARRILGKVPHYFELERFTVKDERRCNAHGMLQTESEASVKVILGDGVVHTVAEGNGPVHALDNALRKALENQYPALSNMRLIDYRVRILKAQDATGAMPRVLITSALHDKPDFIWTTLGVSTNIVEASYEALHDSITYLLLKSQNLQQA